MKKHHQVANNLSTRNEKGDQFQDEDSEELSSLHGTDTHGDEDEDEEENELNIGLEESKAVTRSQIILIVVLVGVAAAVSSAIYVFSRQNQFRDFEDRFLMYGNKITEDIIVTTKRSLKAIDGFALQITIQATDHNLTWPNVMLPNFEQRAKITIDLAEAISLMFIPIVTETQKKSYIDFTLQNQYWLTDGLQEQWRNRHSHANNEAFSLTTIQADGTNTTKVIAFNTTRGVGSPLQIDEESERQSIMLLTQTYGYLNNKHNISDLSFHDRIMKLTGFGVMEDFGTGSSTKRLTFNTNASTIDTAKEPFYCPIWQFAPAIPFSKIVNLNSFSLPSREEQIFALLQTGKPIIGKAIDYQKDDTSARRGALLNLFLNRRSSYDTTTTTTTTTTTNQPTTTTTTTPSSSSSSFLSTSDYYSGGPVSDFYSPIFNNLFGYNRLVHANASTNSTMNNHNTTVVGLLSTYVYWQVYLENHLPNNIYGVIVVLENTCNQTYTFELNGPKAKYLGEGDLHDPKYNHLQVSTGYGTIFHHNSNTNDNDESLDNNTTLLLDPDADVLMQQQINTNAQCLFNINIYPSSRMEKIFTTSAPIIFTIVLASTFLFTSMVFMWHQRLVTKRQNVVLRAAMKSTAVVQSLFPAIVRDRLYEEAKDAQNAAASATASMQGGATNVAQSLSAAAAAATKVAASAEVKSKLLGQTHTKKNNTTAGVDNRNKKYDSDDENGGDDDKCNTGNNNTAAVNKKKKILTSESIFGSKPIADLFTHTTVMFADMVGFTAWASVRDPSQVFTLLETIYHSFDGTAKRMKVFKVETIGDCYVAVCGLPTPRKDHAIVMARFATMCRKQMGDLCQELETTLGPDTADLCLRLGLHSGPVTAGVLRGDKGRFQLFGDTMNTASRMESTGLKNRIHISRDTADILISAGRTKWIEPREEKIIAKGKGEMQTYWLNIVSYRRDSQGSASSAASSERKSTTITAAAASSSLLITKPTDNTTIKADLDDTTGVPQLSENLSTTATSSSSSAFASSSFSKRSSLSTTTQADTAAKTNRLIQWNVEILTKLLRQIIARRQARGSLKNKRNRSSSALSKMQKQSSETTSTTSLSTHGDNQKMVLDEVVDIISLPKFTPEIYHQEQKEIDSIEVSKDVKDQLKQLVSQIGALYKHNPFHNFEHASHVTMSVTKLLGRIVNPAELMLSNAPTANGESGGEKTIDDYNKMASDLHDHTFGITSDPLTQFACVFAALIHDLDHPGVTNAVLVQEKRPEAIKYKNKSVAEQKSVDLAWNIFMSPDFKDLRTCIYDDSPDEIKRFRQLVVNVVMATDIMDKDLGALRKARWEKAFMEGVCNKTEENVNRKATIVIEHLIQASDVAHTMQHWHIYQKWNERLFNEMYLAFKTGRVDKDPSLFWYKGEIGFFDFYIVPLARKLETCGVFGISSDEYLNYALANRREWEERGEGVVKGYVSQWEKNADEMIAMFRE